MSSQKHAVWMLCILCILALGAPFALGQEDAVAQDGGEFARFVSDVSLPFCATVAGYHLFSSDPAEEETGWRVADAIVLSAGVAGLLKAAISANRPEPNHGHFDGMPSGHTAISFATAAALSEQKPRYTLPAYLGAALVGWSRHETQAHYWDQVLVGAVLGSYIGYRAARGDWSIWSRRNEAGFSLSLTEGKPGHAGYSPALRVIYRTSF